MSLIIHENRDCYLYVKLVGDRNLFSELSKGLSRLGALLKKYNVSKMLIDYSEVELNFGYKKSNIFRLLSSYENHFDSTIVCFVVGEKYLDDGRLFVSMCKSRGLRNEVFTSEKAADSWLTTLCT